jgi:hypothetical protein
MALSIYERRRAMVLAIVTVAVLGMVWGNRSSSSTTTVSDTTTTTVAPVADESIPDPVILGGPAPLAPSGSAAIAYPAVNPNERTGLATFSNLGYTQTPVCYSTVIPAGASVTVTNVNNGRTVKCTSVYSLLVPSGMAIMLHSTVFTKIANLIDAPVPVKITW